MADQGEVAASGVLGVPVAHREHQRPGRPYRLSVRLSREERDLIAAAARGVGLTVSGFVARAAVTVAAESVEPTATGDVVGLAAAGDATGDAVGLAVAGRAAAAAVGLRELQRELFAARRAVVLFGGNVNQAAAAYQATGSLPEWVARAVALTAAAVGRLDEVARRVDRRLR